jgi:TnpA family transposase
MVESVDPDTLLIAVERYAGLRRYAPAFLESFTFRSFRAQDALLAAIELLKDLNRRGLRSLPERPPSSFLQPKIRKLIFGEGKPDRRVYEIATLSVLRDRLRSGDVWVEGSREFRPFDEPLMPKSAFAALKDADNLRLGVPRDAAAYLDQTRRTLDFQLKRLAYLARNGKLDGVRLEDGELIVTPLRSDVPPQAEELKWTLNHLLPRVDITDLLSEVNGWTGFADQFTHLHTQDVVRSTPALLTAILGDATNLGPKRMAEASAGISERQVTWARLFHIRPETYKAAQALIVNAHTAHPYAQIWGSGTTSSSDGQFFRAADRAASQSDTNARYSNDPGLKFYTHISDQHGHFNILPMSPTESEAPYVLDGLMNHETKLKIEEHFTDTGGVSDRVFGLFALLGRRFAPRIRDLTGWRFYTMDKAMEKADSYPALKRHIGGVINIQLIRDNWDQLLRLAASMNDGHVSPSTMLKKLAAYPKQNQLARALQELGRIERTLFMIEWYSNPALRRRCQVGLNKGEAANKLKRAVFFHERGEIRDRVFENQAFRASGLNLVVNSIIYWNTIYLSRAVRHLRSGGRDIPDHLLPHVSPQTWEHINLTGVYSWASEPLPSGTFRPLRKPGFAAELAA